MRHIFSTVLLLMEPRHRASVLYCEHRGTSMHATAGTAIIYPGTGRARQADTCSSSQLPRGHRKARIQIASGRLGKGLSEVMS